MYTLDETVERGMELDADLVSGLGDLFPDGHEDGRASLRQAKAGETVDLRQC